MNKQLFLKELEKRRPSIFENYNYDQLPEVFKGTDILTVECKKHGVFQQKAYTHLYGQGCTICGRIKTIAARTVTTEQFIQRSIAKFSNKFNYSKTNYVKKGIALTITCPEHGDFTIRPEAHLWLPYGCPDCNVATPKAIKQQKFIERAIKVHGHKYSYSKVNYANINSKVEIICPKHGSFWQHAQTHVGCKGLKPSNCPKCVIEKGRLSLDSFTAKAKSIHGNKYDYSKVMYETNNSMVTITCFKHGDFIQRAGSHLSGNQCRDCYVEESRHSCNNFIELAKSIHGNKYDYSKVIYKGNKMPVEIICSKHGSFWQRPNSHISSKCGCRFCSESKGENMVELFLLKYDFNFIREYKIKPYHYRYDFYLPDYNIFIEFHGLQHYRPVDFFGGIEEFKKIRERDIIKKQLVKILNSNLIVIPHSYFDQDSIEKYLIYRLKNIYRCWFIINNEIKVFKNELEVCKVFNVRKDLLLRNLTSELRMTVPNFQVLF